MSALQEYTFSDCINLSFVDLGLKVESIYDGAFSCCENLVLIKIPDSVTFIETGAFDGSGLKCVRCNSDSYAKKWAEANAKTTRPITTKLEELLSSDNNSNTCTISKSSEGGERDR